MDDWEVHCMRRNNGVERLEGEEIYLIMRFYNWPYTRTCTKYYCMRGEREGERGYGGDIFNYGIL